MHWMSAAYASFAPLRLCASALNLILPLPCELRVESSLLRNNLSALVLYSAAGMSDSSICKSADHLFLPVLEVYDPLLRCVHCNVFAYQETVKQLAKTRPYPVDVAVHVPLRATPFIQRLLLRYAHRHLQRLWLAVAGLWPSIFPGKSAQSRARASN